jgi:anaerobic selenocysteine-containing dehydrogenase
VLFPHNTLGTGETAHLPWLQATPDPMTSITWQTWVEVNPRKAAELGLHEGDVVTLESPNGRIDVPVYVNPAASPTVLAVPMGQGHTQGGRWATRDHGVRGANPLDLLAPLADATSGALAYGATRVRLISTGRRISTSKLEGNQPPYQVEDSDVAKVTRTV